MAYRPRAGNNMGDVVAFSTSPITKDSEGPAAVTRHRHSDPAADSQLSFPQYTSEPGGGVVGSGGDTYEVPSSSDGKGNGSGSDQHLSPHGANHSNANHDSHHGGSRPLGHTASALAANFTQTLQQATRSVSDPNLNGSGSGTPALFSSSASFASIMGASGQNQTQQVDYKGVTLLPGIERIDFGDSHYIGTVDTEGRMAGYGKATWLSGDEYEGEWLNDCMHGQGVYRWQDGDYYRGEYANGYMNGFGEMKDATGLYIGEWVDDMRQGHGKMQYVGGNVYEGEWLGGARHGHGKLTEASGIVYEGEFVRNEKEGKGIQTNPMGDVYDGDFAHGKPNGRGTYMWHDGAKYIGCFKDGLKHGEGCEWLPDGAWIAGNFVNGEQDEGQVVRHKAIASNFQEPELSDNMATVLQPLDAQQLQKLTNAAAAAEWRIGGRRGSIAIPGAPDAGGAAASYRARRASAAAAAAATTTVSLDPSKNTVEAAHARADGDGNGEVGHGAAAMIGANDGAAAASEEDASMGLSTWRTSKGQMSGTADSTASDAAGSPFTMALRPMHLSDKELENWTQLKIIGKGSFGAVYEALLTTGRTVCCKVIELGNVDSTEELEKLRNEIALMKRMHHPNIVQYYGSTEDKEKNTLNIFMELVSGGSLNSFVKKFKAIPMQTMRQWTYQMACGVKYLHDCGIVHRDIKGDNVLVSLDGIVKLADFGCSKSIDDACSATHGCATMVGTPYWMAPEVIKCEAGGYGAKSDVWSIGCTIVEMITGKPPWPECNSMWAAVYKIANSAGLPTEIPKDLDPQLMSLLERCFERDPRKRASVAELLEHPFLADVAHPTLETTQ